MSQRIAANRPKEKKPDRKKRQAVFKDLGLIEYSLALDIQMETLQSRVKEFELPDCIYLLEHPPVFTLGKNGGGENLIVSDDFLASKKINVIPARRGGNITFHGPGQLVMYPIVNLKKNRIRLNDFVYGLEEIMKKTARDFGIQTERSPKNHGIWVGSQKIGSIGLGIKKDISYHGIALNIDMDLTPFSWVNPCGLTGVCMTSIQNELEKQQSGLKKTAEHIPFENLFIIEKAKNYFKKHFCSIFNFKEMK